MSLTLPFNTAALDRVEADRAARYPISRWYLRPLAARLAKSLAATDVRPMHLTIAGGLVAAAAGILLVAQPRLTPLAGLLVLTAWLCDRADGLLARRQNSETAFGAWLDANIDELVDVGLHAASCYAAAWLTGSRLPYLFFAAFVAGKHLFMYSVASEREIETTNRAPAASPRSTLGRLYHLPSNADVRTHLLAIALFTGALTIELALVAAYYNLRWIARYALVAGRLAGSAA